MATSLETMQKILDVTSLAELRLSPENKLEVRGGVKTAFQKLSDHFAAKSSSGRAALAQRNENLLAALENVVNEARNADIETDSLKSSRYGQLNTKLNTLRELARSRKDAAFKDFADAIKAKPAVQALPEGERKVLLNLCRSIANGHPLREWSGLMDGAQELILLKHRPEFKALSETAQEALLKASRFIEQKCSIEDWGRVLKAMEARFFFDFDPQAMSGKLKDLFIKDFSDPNTLKQFEGFHPGEYDLEIMKKPLEDAALKTQNGKMDSDTLASVREKLDLALRLSLRVASQNGLNPSEERQRNTLTTQAQFFTGQVLELASEVQLPEASKDAFMEQIGGILSDIIAPTTEDVLRRSMNLNGTHENLTKDGIRQMFTSIGGNAVPSALEPNTDAYAVLLKNELKDVDPRLTPFISSMATQFYMGNIISVMPLFLNIPFLTDIASDGMREKNDISLSITRQGRELLLFSTGTRDCFSATDPSKGIFQMRTGACMRIQLDTGHQAEGMPEGFFIPEFTLEELTLDFVPLEAHIVED